mgnify:CR=1 FL=1
MAGTNPCFVNRAIFAGHYLHGQGGLRTRRADSMGWRGRQQVVVDELAFTDRVAQQKTLRQIAADPAQVLSVPTGSDADTARFAVYDRVHTMLEHAATATPLVFVVDDLQWADPMSLGLLTYLMSVLRGRRIIVIATARDGEGGPEVHRFRAAANRSGATVIGVPRLSRDEVAELMRVFLPEGSNEARLIDQIDAHLGKVIELGFLRRLKVGPGQPTMVEVRRLIAPWMCVEIEADAVCG